MGLSISRSKYALRKCSNFNKYKIYKGDKKINEDDSFQSFERAGSFGW